MQDALEGGCPRWRMPFEEDALCSGVLWRPRLLRAGPLLWGIRVGPRMDACRTDGGWSVIDAAAERAVGLRRPCEPLL